MHNLNIPTVMDKIILQAIVQVLTSIYKLYFLLYNYGVRYNRSRKRQFLKW